MPTEHGLCPIHGETDIYFAKVKRRDCSVPQTVRQCLKCKYEYKQKRRQEARRRLFEWMGEKCFLCEAKCRLALCFHKHNPKPLAQGWGLKHLVDEVLKGGFLLCNSCQASVNAGKKEVSPEAVKEHLVGLPPFHFREHLNAELPAEAVKAIREDTISTHADLARMHGVDEKTVRAIRRGERRGAGKARH